MKNAIATTKAPGAIGPYSQGIDAGTEVYCSGQLPIDAATGEMGKDIVEMTKNSLNNLKAILEENGMTMDNVVKTTVFMTDLADFGAMNEVYASYFSAPFPARSAVQVAALPKGAAIEIECIAKK
ncbi:RidA family protein [Hespellia stercorisuis]|uniref:2-iminobutanoate/2-iminopropanoate deaminase n=1 Tax=Hespellia stercorisuis DSM 15480 TaxID=1121950 RepID=A0A1M6KPD6_9FIRM|nr:RidA family protein [Hespellia stercorisuis]SHJ60863.1 2-iminobutanoate/2-iminopropanoate deaminase [Hespellia stercorisuis DSM 15480]